MELISDKVHRMKAQWECVRWPVTPTVFLGPLLVLLAEVFGAFMAVSTKLLQSPDMDGNPGMHTEQILFVRFSITTVLCLIYMWWKGVEDAPLGKPEVRKLLVLRGVFGFIGCYGYYYSLSYLPLTEAMVIYFVTPLLASFAATIFLKESFSRVQTLAALVVFSGVIVVTDPLQLSGVVSGAESSFARKVTTMQRLIAIGAGLCADFAAAGAYTTIRAIGTRAHTLISVNYYGFFAMTLSGLILVLPFFPDVGFSLPRNTREWLLLLWIGVSGFLLQFLLTAGLAMDKSSRTTNMMYSQVVFGLILDKVIWGTVLTWTSWLGGSVVVGGVIWGSLQKQDKDKVPDAESYQSVPLDELTMSDEDTA